MEESSGYEMKLDFGVKLKEGQTVKDAVSSITINGNDKSDYYGGDFYIYKASDVSKYKEEGTKICYVFKHDALASDYILKADESYVIGVEDFILNEFDLQLDSEGYIFINGKDISELNSYCWNASENKANAENFAFEVGKPTKTTTNTSEKTTSVEEETTGTDTMTTGEEQTTTVETDDTQTTIIAPKENFNNFFGYTIVGISILLIILSIVVVAKFLKKDKNS